ncbi:uncharacterized protein CcaverHIS019_0208410 [Cutaneotrichosporon cavernicola]|uniref:Flavoprotein domain-containing protein n=1 Tax=Cutaneotrichosporon cavernicola TaxID=279322 RepID=A0AA48KYJ8_9TREE|nr:uncharacterized protein CcaverHIS019_0208410 [Cutaneotrichosporon cavernicola]BEI89479.1 hypothetical protein CcaverHIS019_0208410 [Cutaneotrichosporon cavernicola]BEI97252.1 hypothetical protein CcaverHIS631_0208410 [Cutaneotrichosporon cavernicola]BEJ05026.1 hypothetical protein CcaverHIS641_0208430 [Cutaneotrichosporon cavernicola]
MAAPYTYYPPRIQIRPPIKANAPFRASDHRPKEYDGKFRVVLVSSDSPASAAMPSLVGSLCRDPSFDLQVVATLSSLRYYDQRALDDAVKAAWDIHDDGAFDWGVRRWTDTDEAEAWSRPGDPVLASELARWADLVVIVPCSADMLAKTVNGFSDNLGLALLRSLPSITPILLCPAMTPEMHANAFTQKHTITARASGFIVLGPQGTSKNEHRGEMTDWRDIVNAIQDMAALHQMRQAQAAAERIRDPSSGPAVSGYQPTYMSGPVVRHPTPDPMTLMSAIGKAGTPARAFEEAETAQGKWEDGMVVDTVLSSDKDGEKDKGKTGGVQVTGNFQTFRPGWGEVPPIDPNGFLFAVPGLATTEPGRINLGPRAEGLTKVPHQCSAADHWRSLSETGNPFGSKANPSTVGTFIAPSTMVSPSRIAMSPEETPVGMSILMSSMQVLDHGGESRDKR